MLEEDSQNSPVSDVHAAFPQMQGAALLGADPSVFVQAGAVRVHMHVYQVEQDVVEEVFVLNHRSPEENFQHPRGEYEDDPTSAVVSEYPCAVAASSHSAWLPTHAHPLLSVQYPDVRVSNSVSSIRFAASSFSNAVDKEYIIGHSPSIFSGPFSPSVAQPPS